MATGVDTVSQSVQPPQGGQTTVDTMHELHGSGAVCKEFNLPEARKKLKALQQEVSPVESSQTPKVLLDSVVHEKFAGKSLSKILMVELYAGSARLSRACQQMGVRSIAVDKTSQRSQGTRIFVCDVTDPAELATLESFLAAEKEDLAWVHFAPACGTASRAREKAQQKFGASWLQSAKALQVR